LNKKNNIKIKERHSFYSVLFAMAIVLIASNGFSQFADTRYAIGSAGRSVTTGDGMTYMFNIGEPAVTTASPGLIITQGFEQPPYARDAAPTPPVDTPQSISVNAFSPDGDGVNDGWVIPELSDFPDNEVTIMNRWGDMIWSAQNYDNVDIIWNGTNTKNEKVANGTYFYVIKINNLPRSFSGWVQVTK